MARGSAGLNVVITGDTKGLERATRNARGELDKLGKQTSVTGRVTSKGFAGVGIAARGMAAGLGAGVLAGGYLTKQFVESNKVAKQTDAVLKSTAGAANVTAKQVGDLATAISRKTGIDDEAIQSGENLLLTFTNVRNEAGRGNKIFDQSTRLLADMSTALGQDTKSSAIQLGKALNDPIKGVTALQRVGVSFTAKQKDQIKALVDSGHAMDAQKLILRELNKEFGGSAAAQATPFDKIKVSAGNLAETLGGYLAPALGKAASFTNRFLVQLQDGTGAGGKFITWVKGAASTMRGAWQTATGAVSRFLDRNRDDINSLGRAMRNVGIAIKAVVENVLIPVVKRLFPVFKGVFEGVVTVLRGVIRVVSGVLTGNWRKAWDGIKDIVKGAARAIIAVWGNLGKALIDAAKAAGKAIGKGILAGLGNLGHLMLDKVKDSLGFVAKNLPTGPVDIGKGIGKAIAKGVGIGGDGAGKLPSGGGPVGSLMGANAALGPFAAIGAKFGLHVSSGRRPGSITSSGNVSFHSSGEAIDMSDGRGPDNNKLKFFNYMKNMFGGRLAELIYTPGGAGIKNGQSFQYTGSVAADHYDHVHVALDTGRPGIGDGLGKFVSTSYGPPWGGIQGTGTTATGVDLHNNPHTYGIAVDPSRLKLGKSYYAWPNPFGYRGKFKAFDTGGAIKGNRIDFYDWRGRSKQMGWGRRTVEISTSGPGTKAAAGAKGKTATGRGGKITGISFGNDTGPSAGASLGMIGAGASVFTPKNLPTELDYINAAGANASLTAGTADDIRAATGLRDYYQRAYNKARKTKDPRDDIDAATNLKSAIDALAQLTEAVNAQTRIEEERAAVNTEILANQKLLLKLAGQGDQILAAVIAAVNGGIGGKVGLGFASPSYPGGVATY